jgi:single-stranded-DNA-specific exonuclease
LSLQSKRWQIAPPVTAEYQAALPHLPPLVVQLLFNRKIKDPSQASDFLAGRFAADNPFQLKGMDQAVTRLRQAIREGEPIAVYGDFDTDGVTATALLVETLSALGAQVTPYIPHRVDEGYGLHLDALRRLYGQGVRVVVTVDCGIRSLEEVDRASRGLDLIITDHHSPKENLPRAVAIINPKQPGCRYPFKGLSGVGLAFKLARALLLVQQQGGQPPTLTEDALLDLVALGTVADLASLQGENRTLVRRGLKALNESRRLGVAALMADAGLRRGEIDAVAIGFRLGPRINAAGRIDTAMLAYDLLTSNDPLHTRELAGRLGELNQERQRLTEEAVIQAEAQIEAGERREYFCMATSASFNSGVVGLAASRLSETYYRPSVVVQVGERESRGSCRSIPEFDIIAALDRCAELLIRHGGHPAAAGFTIATDRLGELQHRLQDIAAEQLAGMDLRPTLDIDAELPLEQVDWATQGYLDLMEPCGVDNPRPILVSRNVAVSARRAIGNGQKQHLKLVLRDGRGIAWDGIAFRRGDLAGQVPDRVDVAYTLESREWNGEKHFQLDIQDMRAAE